MSYDWKQRDPEGYARWESGYGFLERADMTGEMLTKFTGALEVIQRSGAVVKEITVDKKTMDRLWFEMNQRDLRRTASKKREPYYYIEIYGVAVNEAHPDRTEDVCGVLTPEIMRDAMAEVNEPFEPFDVGQYIIEGASK